MEIQWPLVIFTLCVCLSAGIFALQGLLCVLGKGEKTQNLAVITSFAVLVIGGIASFLHLEHWSRIFNGFGHLSSGITQELIGIVVMVVVMAVFFVLGRKGLAPKWAGGLAILASFIVVALLTTSYLMPSRPVWSSPLLYLFYFAQALVGGAAALWIIGGITQDEESTPLMIKCTAVSGAVVVVSLLAYIAVAGSAEFADFGSTYDTTQPLVVPLDTSNLTGQLLSGPFALPFWLSVIFGGLVPAALGFLKWKGQQPALPMAAVCIICALIGGVAFRAVLYLLGFTVVALF